MHEKEKQKIISEAKAQLEKATLGQASISEEYKKFLTAIDAGTCPSCGVNLEIVEAEESDDSFRYKYKCGHSWQGFNIRETMKVRETLKLTAKRPGFGLLKKMVQGFRRSGDVEKFPEGVDVQMVVDRENNEYHHIVKDNKTGQVIHEEHETLTEHGAKKSSK